MRIKHDRKFVKANEALVPSSSYRITVANIIVVIGLCAMASHLAVITYAAAPNVLLILSDDQTWTDYSFMGHPHIETPNLDRLAAESLTYSRGYVSSPLCRPSLASIITGLPTHVHGITGNDPTTGDNTIRNMASRSYPRHSGLHEVLYERIRSLPNLVRELEKVGYRTMQTGKWWEADPQPFGFTRSMTHGEPTRGARHGDEGLTISRQGIEPIRKFLDACQATEKQEAKPFFLWHAPLLPHTPHNPPAELLKKYEQDAPSKSVASYWAMCEWFDQTCGELLNEFAERGLSENTLIIYIVDNGWIQHPETPNMFAPRSKGEPEDGGIRTPIMLCWPGNITPSYDSSTLVSAIDLAPTILNACGIDVPEGMPGVDLRDTQALRKRNRVFGSDHPHDIADVNHPNQGVEARFVIEGPWKLIVRDSSDSKLELFHLEADPYEQTNLSRTHPEIAARLKRDLQEWWADTPYQ